jgi:hypothetical protein
MSEFDVEQEIFRCWHVVEDLQLLYEAMDTMNADQRQNYILGLITIYNTRFNSLMDLYEAKLKQDWEEKQKSHEQH